MVWWSKFSNGLVLFRSVPFQSDSICSGLFRSVLICLDRSFDLNCEFDLFCSVLFCIILICWWFARSIRNASTMNASMKQVLQRPPFCLVVFRSDPIWSVLICSDLFWFVLISLDRSSDTNCEFALLCSVLFYSVLFCSVLFWFVADLLVRSEMRVRRMVWWSKFSKRPILFCFVSIRSDTFWSIWIARLIWTMSLLCFVLFCSILF
jgi:hypothetical protein